MDLGCLFFPSSLSCKVRWLILNLFYFLIWKSIAINFHLNTTFPVPLKFWYTVFIIYFWSIDCFRVCCLISTNFLIFQLYCCYWFLTSSYCGWRRYFYDMYLLKSIEINLWLNIWSTLENILCTLEKNIYAIVIA